MPAAKARTDAGRLVATEASARRAAFAFRVRKDGNDGANAMRVDYASTARPIE
jgi:hypothetical protein